MAVSHAVARADPLAALGHFVSGSGEGRRCLALFGAFRGSQPAVAAVGSALTSNATVHAFLCASDTTEQLRSLCHRSSGFADVFDDRLMLMPAAAEQILALTCCSMAPRAATAVMVEYTIDGREAAATDFVNLAQRPWDTIGQNYPRFDSADGLDLTGAVPVQ